MTGSDCIAFKGGQSADGGLGIQKECAQTMQGRMSALEPTVCYRRRTGCGQTSTVRMVYHENGGNESFEVGGKGSGGKVMSTLKVQSNPHMSHDFILIRK